MKKKILIGAVVIILIIIFFSGNSKKESDYSSQTMFKNTINISRSYIVLRIKTDQVLTNAKDYKDYKTWNNEMTKLIDNWKKLEVKAKELESISDEYSQEKISFNFVSKARAYTKDEISNVFDNALAGKKIRTLAKYLGVDAKRAYKILQNDQEFVKADAWNQAGDIFKKLEVSAVVIKDGCKVAGFIGAAAITGGATAGATIGSAGVTAGLVGGTATAVEATVMVVTGTDLLLEVSEDGTTIGLGDNHKVTKMISKIRSYTEPAASILSLTDIPKNVSKGAKLVDKVGVLLMEVDQIRSILQDGKLLGIDITPDLKAKIATLKKDEIKKWIKENKKNTNGDWMNNLDSLEKWLNNIDEKNKEIVSEGENIEKKKNIEVDKDKLKKEKNKDSNSDNIKNGYSKDGKVSVSIVEPGDDSIFSGGSFRIKVRVDGTSYEGEKRGYKCHTEYYTEYDGAKPWMNNACDGISGVPGKDIYKGMPSAELKIVAVVDLLEQEYGKDQWGYKVRKGTKVVETIKAERLYEIKPYKEDN